VRATPATGRLRPILPRRRCGACARRSPRSARPR
jgi:hypothetical protein